ncbi:MAG: aminotransferase class V-fold PLP-dependent enzyme [Planctomycetota bacterium]
MLREEIDRAVQEALTSSVNAGMYKSYLGEASSAMCAELCKQFAQDECLPASSGTAALEVTLRAIGLSEGDEVLLSGYDYPGNFWAIERAGGFPLLVDTEVDSWNISVDSIQHALESSPRCRAVVVSHLHGAIQDVRAVRELCDRHDLVLIEDCCQLWGPGLGAHADAVVVSFGGGKLVSAGRGGAMMTRDPGLAQKAKIAAGAGSGPYAMSEIQCAIVLAQLPFLQRLIGAIQSYFGNVAEEMEQMQSESHHDAVEIVRPGSATVEAAEYGFYQMGWLRYENAAVESPLSGNANEPASGLGPGLGQGFPGFHRRSSRRCRIPTELDHVRKIVPRTMVAHHRIALDGDLAPADLAKAIMHHAR